MSIGNVNTTPQSDKRCRFYKKSILYNSFPHPYLQDIGYVIDYLRSYLRLPASINSKETNTSNMKIKKIILAIPTAAPAIPVNPNAPAISAMIKNIITHLSI